MGARDERMDEGSMIKKGQAYRLDPVANPSRKPL